MLCRNSVRSAQHLSPSACRGPCCATGPTLAASAPSVRPAGTVSSTFRASKATKSSKPNLLVREFSTPVCLPRSSGTTSADRNSTCKTVYLTNVPDASKSPTSDPASTSRGPDFYAFWDSSSQDLYERLSCLPETGSPGSGSSSSSGCLPSTTPASSFLTVRTELPKRNLEKTSWPSYKYTVVDGTDVGGTKSQLPKLKTLKLRLCPTAEQKKTLDRWAGCSRFTYNAAVALRLGEGSTQKDTFRIRDRIVTLKKRSSSSQNSFFKNKAWLLDCPKSVRQSAVASAVENVKACFSNLKAGNVTHFSAPFRTKKNQALRGWAFGLDQKNVRRDGDRLFVFQDFLGEIKYYGRKQLRKLLPGTNPSHDPKIQKSAYGEYFLVMSVDWVRRERRTVTANILVKADGTVSWPITVHHNTSNYEGFAAASLDPGVRKTATTFSPENEEAFMFGKGQATQLTQLLLAYDKLLSGVSKKAGTSGERDCAKAEMRRIRKRVFYLKKEFRDKVANFLARRYEVLLVPKLGTKDMTLSAGRRLRTKVVRQMLTLGHASIFNRLREKCAEYGTTFLEVKENYTSQTCPKCGTLRKSSSETYNCQNCKFSCDRDIVGALNIFLKAVRKTKPLVGAPQGVQGPPAMGS